MADVANVGPTGQGIPVPRTAWDADMLYIHVSKQIEELKSHLGDLRTADLLALQAAFSSAEKAVDRAMQAQEKAVAAALEAEQRTTSLLQATDTKLQDMQSKYTENHLNQLNESAKRSVEERSHFVSIDSFEPFRQQTLEFMNKTVGRQTATVAIMGALFAIISLALRFL